MDQHRMQRARAHDDHELDHALGARTTDATARETPHEQLGNQGVQRLAAAGVQAKLEVGGADDAYEQEADRVADEVMGGRVAPPARTADASAVQRTGGGEAFAADEDVSARIDGARGGGQALPDGVRSMMETKTGADFSAVRVHDDAQAHQLTAEVGAHAFTHGQDIHFARGAYDPSSREGQHLLAHELTHVVQQAGGQRDGVQRKAISAAPSSVQRLWNPFKKKEPRPEAKDEVEMPAYYDMLKNPKLKEHFVQWNANHAWGDPTVWWHDRTAKFDEHLAECAQHARAALDGLVRNDGDLDELLAIADVEEALASGRFTRTLLDPLKSVAGKSSDPKAFFQAAVAYAQAFDRAAKLCSEMQTFLATRGGDLNVKAGEVQRVQQLFGQGVLYAGMLKMSEGNHGGASDQMYTDTYAKQQDVQDFYRDNM